MDLPPLVREVIAAYLALVDCDAPGLVQGLYLTGSVALSDFRPPARGLSLHGHGHRRCAPHPRRRDMSMIAGFGSQALSIPVAKS